MSLTKTLGLTLGLLLQANLFAADTIPSWNGTSFISSFGVPNTATYGQTLTTALSERKLQSISFRLDVRNGPVTFRGHIFAWDGSKATGPSLYASSPMTLQANPGVFQTVTFDTGGLDLPPGQYVFFASVSED